MAVWKFPKTINLYADEKNIEQCDFAFNEWNF